MRAIFQMWDFGKKETTSSVVSRSLRRPRRAAAFASHIQAIMTLDLTDDEARALAKHLRQIGFDPTRSPRALTP